MSFAFLKTMTSFNFRSFYLRESAPVTFLAQVWMLLKIHYHFPFIPWSCCGGKCILCMHTEVEPGLIGMHTQPEDNLLAWPFFLKIMKIWQPLAMIMWGCYQPKNPGLLGAAIKSHLRPHSYINHTHFGQELCFLFILFFMLNLYLCNICSGYFSNKVVKRNYI